MVRALAKFDEQDVAEPARQPPALQELRAVHVLRSREALRTNTAGMETQPATDPAHGKTAPEGLALPAARRRLAAVLPVAREHGHTGRNLSGLHRGAENRPRQGLTRALVRLERRDEQRSMAEEGCRRRRPCEFPGKDFHAPCRETLRIGPPHQEIEDQPPADALSAWRIRAPDVSPIHFQQSIT